NYRSGELRSPTSLLSLGLVPRHSFGPALPSPGLREGGAKRMPLLPTSPSARFPALPVDLGRRPVVQGLVQTLLVVIREVPPQPPAQAPARTRTPTSRGPLLSPPAIAAPQTRCPSSGLAHPCSPLPPPPPAVPSRLPP